MNIIQDPDSRFIAFAFAIMAILAPVSSLAQKVTPQEAMLARVALKYQSLTSLSHKIKGTMKIDVGGATFTAAFKTSTQMARPKQFRSDVEVGFFGTTSKGTAVTDGKSFWDFDPVSNEYSEQTYEDVTKEGDKKADWLMDRAGLDFPLMLFLDASKSPMFKVKPGAEKAIQVKKLPVKVVDGVPVHVLAIPVPSEKGKKPGTATLYVGAKDMLIRRCRLSLMEKDAKGESIGVEFVCFYTEIKPNATMDSATFTFAPPQEAKKVEKIIPAFDRAFNQPGD